MRAYKIIVLARASEKVIKRQEKIGEKEEKPHEYFLL